MYITQRNVLLNEALSTRSSNNLDEHKDLDLLFELIKQRKRLDFRYQKIYKIFLHRKNYFLDREQMYNRMLRHERRHVADVHERVDGHTCTYI